MADSSMFGVLVDVSGSMRNAFALDSSNDASVERVHAIITSIVNIVNKEVTRYNRQEEIFVSAFGLAGNVNTCDLIALLDLIAGPKNLRGLRGHDALVALAKENGASHAEGWIRKHLSNKQAQDLYKVMCFDTSLVQRMVEKLPQESMGTSTLSFASNWVPGGSYVEGKAVHRSEAYIKFYAEVLIRDVDNIIKRALAKIEHPTPKPVQYVSRLFEDLNMAAGSSSESIHSRIKDNPVQYDSRLFEDLNMAEGSSSESIHSRIKDLIEPIKPYIFGGTPMRKAMNDALSVFRSSRTESRVLFILSDGESADGDPQDIAQELEKLDVITVTCYLTDSSINNPTSLLDKIPSDWSKKDGRVTLFNMSSTMRNTDAPLSYLVDAGWEVPASGESRLFIQANSLDVVDELCKTVVPRLTDPCNALMDVLKKVPLASYINHKNAEFNPKEQVGGTCYANAVAAVFHLAVHRIVGHKGGYPDFFDIRDARLILEFGMKGANTKSVLEKVCPEYRLHFKEVDETGARQALNHRRPLVATFSLFDEQWDRFSAFYTASPKAILQKSDVGNGSTKPVGHAVVLMSCNPQCLVFMNSWGQGWADGGFFRVKDAQVLNDMKLYDVYWTLNDLEYCEKEAYRREGLEKAKELANAYPSINDLLVQCTKCKRNSRVGDFKGDLLKAICPRCGESFQPKNEDLFKSLYLRNM